MTFPMGRGSLCSQHTVQKIVEWKPLPKTRSKTKPHEDSFVALSFAGMTALHSHLQIWF